MKNMRTAPALWKTELLFKDSLDIIFGGPNTLDKLGFCEHFVGYIFSKLNSDSRVVFSKPCMHAMTIVDSPNIICEKIVLMTKHAQKNGPNSSFLK